MACRRCRSITDPPTKWTAKCGRPRPQLCTNGDALWPNRCGPALPRCCARGRAHSDRENCRCQNQFGMDDRGKGQLNLFMPIKKQKGDDQMQKSKRDSTAYVGSIKILYDVPVYRLPKDKYESQQKAFIERELKINGGKFGEEMYRCFPDVKTKDENHLWKIYGGNWIFNEIIGFIRLFFLSTQIRGEYWPIIAKKITRTRRKIFRPLGHEITHPETIPPGSSNQDIYNLILKFLTRTQCEKELKKRHVYTSLLENIGPYVDWNALLEEQFRRQPPSDSCQPMETK